nr:hypothetical protein KK1_010337 [Ipomoea batatas]
MSQNSGNYRWNGKTVFSAQFRPSKNGWRLISAAPVFDPNRFSGSFYKEPSDQISSLETDDRAFGKSEGLEHHIALPCPSPLMISGAKYSCVPTKELDLASVGSTTSCGKDLLNDDDKGSVFGFPALVVGGKFIGVKHETLHEGSAQKGSMHLDPAHGPEILAGSSGNDDFRRVGLTEHLSDRSKSLVLEHEIELLVDLEILACFLLYWIKDKIDLSTSWEELKFDVLLHLGLLLAEWQVGVDAVCKSSDCTILDSVTLDITGLLTDRGRGNVSLVGGFFWGPLRVLWIFSDELETHFYMPNFFSFLTEVDLPEMLSSGKLSVLVEWTPNCNLRNRFCPTIRGEGKDTFGLVDLCLDFLMTSAPLERENLEEPSSGVLEIFPSFFTGIRTDLHEEPGSLDNLFIAAISAALRKCIIPGSTVLERRAQRILFPGGIRSTAPHLAFFRGHSLLNSVRQIQTL